MDNWLSVRFMFEESHDSTNILTPAAKNEYRPFRNIIFLARPLTPSDPQQSYRYGFKLPDTGHWQSRTTDPLRTSNQVVIEKNQTDLLSLPLEFSVLRFHPLLG